MTVAATEPGVVKTLAGDRDPGPEVPVDTTYDQVKASDFDALVLPGGTLNGDQLRADETVQQVTRAFAADAKPVAAICHAPWVLAEAGVVSGRRLTAFASLETDLRNAGATWVDEEVVVDQGLVSSRTPDDLPAFNAKVVEEIGEGKHEGQTA